MSKEKIEVPLYVIEDLEEIRKSGKFNMVMDAGLIFDKLYKSRNKTNTFWWLAKIRGERAFIDRDKYSAALMELGEIRGLADTLSAD